MVILDVTTVPGTDTIQLVVQGKDPVSGNYVDLASETAVTTSGTRSAVIYPGAGTVATDGVTVSRPYPLPRTWRARVVHSGSGNFIYSIGASYIT